MLAMGLSFVLVISIAFPGDASSLVQKKISTQTSRFVPSVDDYIGPATYPQSITRTPPGITFAQQREDLIEQARVVAQSARSNFSMPALSSHTDRGIGNHSDAVCFFVSLSSPQTTSNIGNFSYGELAKSVLDTWGSVAAPDLFRLVFPSAADQSAFGLADPRLRVLDPGPFANATMWESPSTLRTLEAIRLKKEWTDLSSCMWYVMTGVDVYVNPDAMRTQLMHLDPSVPYFLGSVTSISDGWDPSFYGPWMSGANGHIMSKALVDSVDWGACLWEVGQRQEAGTAVRWDDVETGACVHRHRPDSNIVRLDPTNSLWTQAHEENSEARAMIDGKDPEWQNIVSAHRMTPQLNYDAADLLSELS